MKIVADKDIFRVDDFFSSLGDIHLLPGRSIMPEHVADADALLVRTVTQVNLELVQGSSLRFIGSATSGTDHVDRAALSRQGIHFIHAPGCNADAVVDYFFSAMAWIASIQECNWRNRSVGIIGAGNVGSRLAKKLMSLGMSVAIHDPYLDATHDLAAYFVSLEDVLQQGIVTLHTPLTTSGSHPTSHLLDASRLALLRHETILVNASRGEVVDNKALAQLLAKRIDLTAVLDVWEGEPLINRELARRTTVATPHIAGYSLNGKLNATETIYRQFCRCFSIASENKARKYKKIQLNPILAPTTVAKLNPVLLQSYPINRDFLKVESEEGKEELAGNFDGARNNYILRREYSDYSIRGDGISQQLANELQILGFEIN